MSIEHHETPGDPTPSWQDDNEEGAAREEHAAYYEAAAERFEAALPYAGTSGHSGTDTSAARAEREDTGGTTAMRQNLALEHIRLRRHGGITVAELREATGWHHGQASGPLSVLHKVGKIARLTEVRGRCKVYVLPEYVDGRDTEEYQRNRVRDGEDIASLLAREAGYAEGMEEGTRRGWDAAADWLRDGQGYHNLANTLRHNNPF